MFNTLTDWGKVLDQFGLQRAAIEQETEVLRKVKKHSYARLIRGQIEVAMWCQEIVKKGMKNCESKTETPKTGLSDLEMAVTDNNYKDDFVLQGYLEALIETGSADKAVAAYEEWGNKDYVPKPGRARMVNPHNIHVRLSYAKALLKKHQWQRAILEFQALALEGFKFNTRDIAELKQQAQSTGGDQKLSDEVNSLMQEAISAQGPPAACPHTMPESTSLRYVSIH
jgi:hypothetical protein